MDATQLAFSYAKQATRHDSLNQPQRALELYILAAENLLAAKRAGGTSQHLMLITSSLKNYVHRAEQLKKQLQHPQSTQAHVTAAPATASGDTRGRFCAVSGMSSRWDDVVGVSTVKTALQDAIQLPIRFPSVFKGALRPWRGILLYGPPGTGKTMIARATAGEFGPAASFYAISSADIVSKWQGESEQHVRALFETARQNAPSVVFIDEVDALCGTRDKDGESDSARRIKTQFLTEMDGMQTSTASVLVLAATNTPFAIDSAMRRRFERRIYVPLPDESARAHMIRASLVGAHETITPGAITRAAKSLALFSGADIANLMRDVLLQPLHKLSGTVHFQSLPDGKYCPCSPGAPGAVLFDPPPSDSSVALPPVDDIDLMRCVVSAKPSTSDAELLQYTEFTEQFGSVSD